MLRLSASSTSLWSGVCTHTLCFLCGGKNQDKEEEESQEVAVGEHW
jgi:hypothetical protein